ncbi:hypothetical protein C8R44DRAFT_177246 [Mycena epipterygia]|nr:hypothetical protein C8R44DRAFT_177246 [Mycena epipterygia]
MVALNRSTVFRIVSLSLAGGDVCQTIPATYRMYKKQVDRRRLSAVCFFYAMARYFSIGSLVANGFGAFWTHYTPETCKHVYMFPNVTALIAGMSVQMVVFIRTYAISGRSKYVRFGLGSVLLLGFPVQIFGIVYHRDPFFNNGMCKGEVLHAGEPDWNIVYYSAHMAWDLIACATATYYLVASSRVQGTPFIQAATPRSQRRIIVLCGCIPCEFLGCIRVRTCLHFGCSVVSASRRRAHRRPAPYPQHPRPDLAGPSVHHRF